MKHVDFEVDRILYLERLESSDEREEPIKLRLEVLKSFKDGTYHAKVYRIETYSMKASFGTEEVWGKEILISDEHAEWEKICSDSAENVIDEVIKLLPYH